MPTQPLPSGAELADFRGRAETLRDWARAGAPGAVALVHEHHPAGQSLDLGALSLEDARLTLARHHGLASWAGLVAHLRLVEVLARSPHEQPEASEPADELVRLACLTYGADDPARVDRAAALLTARPDLGRTNAWTAAVTGDAERLAELLAAEPELVRTDGGPYAWVPLVCLTYSRLDVGDPVATARVLLAAGTDPDAGYLWEGLVPPFTALAGAFGDGEGQQPPHPRWRELARLLLDAGADPNDAQTVYNGGLGSTTGDTTEVLSLLLEFGFGHGDGGPWKRRLGDAQPTPAELVAEELAHAATRGLPRRTRLLLEHGADPDSRGRHPAFGGRTAYESAVAHGHPEVAALLAAAGADTAVDPLTTLLGDCLSGDRDAVLAADPELLRQAHDQVPGLLSTAAQLGRGPALRLLVELGWDVNAEHPTAPLHEAALRGDRALVDLLLELGADPAVRDGSHDADAAGWAEHAGHAELAGYLGSRR